MIHGLYIIIPAKNEKKNLLKVIKKFNQYGKIIVVNDNSIDTTKSIAEKKAFKVINNNQTYGYDLSLRRGIKEVIKLKNAKYILTIDADDQHPAINLRKMMHFMKSYDLIIFNRKKLSRASEYIVDFFSRKFFSIKDPLSGMKLYKTIIVKKKISKLNIKEDYIGMFFFKIFNIKKILNFEINTNNSNKESSFGNGLFTNIKIIKAFIKSI
jgi:glycosyltransferase involved in cell wall biosynthesis